MTQTDVAKRQDQNVQRIQAPETDTIYVPEVDIHEDAESYLLTANLPGADQESVSIAVENGVLTIEGTARADTPESYELVGQEYGVGRYRRDFTFSDAVKAEGITARMRNGVLSVTLPKREAVKTRAIRIET